MYTYSSKSPPRKAFFTLGWLRGQSKFIVKDKRTAVVFNLATHEQKSLSSL